MKTRSILIVPIVCLALLSGCTTLTDDESINYKLSKAQAIDAVKEYVRVNKMYFPDYLQVVKLDTKGSAYIVESYYTMYDEAGFLDKICIGKFTVDTNDGEVKGRTVKPYQESVYRGINQGIEKITTCY